MSNNLILSINNKIKELIINKLNDYLIKNNINQLNNINYQIFINNMNNNNNFIYIVFNIIFYTYNSSDNTKNNINYLYYLGQFYIDNNELKIYVINDKKNIIPINNQIKKISILNDYVITLNNNNQLTFYNNNLSPQLISYNISNIVNISSNNNNLLYVLYKDNNNYIINSYIINNNSLQIQNELYNVEYKINDIYYFNNDLILLKEIDEIINDISFKKISFSYNNNDLLFINSNQFYCYSNQKNFFISFLSNINNYDMILSTTKTIGETINEIYNFDIMILHYFIENNNIIYKKIKINYNNLNFIINTQNNRTEEDITYNNYTYDFDNNNKFFNYNIINYNNEFYLLNNNFNIINVNKLFYEQKYKLTNYKIINEDNQIKFKEIIQTNNYIIDNNIFPSLDNLIGINNYNDKILYCYNDRVEIYNIINNQLVKEQNNLPDVLSNIKIISSLNKLTKHNFSDGEFNNSVNVLMLGYVEENNNVYTNKIQIYNYNEIDNNFILKKTINLDITDKYMTKIIITYGTLLVQNGNNLNSYIINNIYILFNDNTNDNTIKHYIYNYLNNDEFYYKDDFPEILNSQPDIIFYQFDGLDINNKLYFAENDTNNSMLLLYNENNIINSLIYYLKKYIYLFIENNILYLLDTEFKLNKYNIFNNSTLLYNIDYLIYPNDDEILELNNLNIIDNIKNNIDTTCIFGHYFINNSLHILIYKKINNNDIKLEFVYNNIL